MGKRAKKIDRTRRHFFYLVTDGNDVYVMPEKYPYLFEFTYSDEGIETLYGNRKNISTGIRYNSKRHSIIYQGRAFHLNTYIGGRVWLWTRGEITRRELLQAHEYNRRRYINERKLEELDRIEKEETKREIERERKESKRKVIEVFCCEHIHGEVFFTTEDAAIKYLKENSFLSYEEMLEYYGDEETLTNNLKEGIRKITYNCVE